jgi:hypothetical protein
MFTVGCEPCMKRVEMVKFLEELLATPPALPVKEWSRLEMMYPVAGIH